MSSDALNSVYLRADAHAPSQPRQNWILDPLQDALFVIAAPLLVLAAALIAFKTLGGAAAASLIIVTHIVFTVAHHLPTFIRVYGDVELFRRFKWSFVLAPVVPLTFCACVLGYIEYKGYPLEYFLYLYIMLVLWDPWHFLRQHYGFMRIYDRHNAAPRRIAARMDLALCVAWFVFIMLASGAWLADVLQDLYSSARLPLVLAVPSGAVAMFTALARDAAIAMTLVYGAYLAWCRYRGYFISAAKLALFAITFGVMYVAYTPNDWILGVAPEWTFQVGFAAVGIVHMTQYLAIVWRYNRSLAARPERARRGWFRNLHARGGWLIGIGYVALCLLYGEFVTTRQANQVLMSVLLAIGFTSTLLHYYFDGFIWKVRHEQNSENLAPPDRGSAASGSSWWQSFRAVAPRTMLLRQTLYFGVPMLILTVGAVSVWSAPSVSYIDRMYRAQELSQQGDALGAQQAAESAYAAMRQQLPLAQRMAELQPTSAREAELAFLLYNASYYERVVLPAIAGLPPNADAAAQHRESVAGAAELLASAIERDGQLAHAGRARLTREDALRTLASWRKTAELQVTSGG
jgi:hypothetical protein